MNEQRTWCVMPRGWVRVRCSHASVLTVPVRCRECSGCAEARRGRVQWRVGHGIRTTEGRSAFLTLTSLPGTSVASMMKAWNRFKGWLRRRLGAFEYAAVKEFGSDTGMLHLHVVVLGWRYVPQRVLSAAWERASGARVVHIKAVPEGGAEGAARYLSKYVSKALDVEDVRKRVTYSRGFPRPDAEAERWVKVGETWQAASAPPGSMDTVMPSGAVVLHDAGCGCVARARPAGLAGQLFFWRLSRAVAPG